MTDARPPADLDRVVHAMDLQIAWCRANGAPFTADVVEAVRANVVRGGALAALVVPWHGNPAADAVQLRIAGALHLMVRLDRAGKLAAFYPGHGNAPWDPAAAGQAIEEAIVANMALMRDGLSRPPQTN